MYTSHPPGYTTLPTVHHPCTARLPARAQVTALTRAVAERDIADGRVTVVNVRFPLPSSCSRFTVGLVIDGSGGQGPGVRQLLISVAQSGARSSATRFTVGCCYSCSALSSPWAIPGGWESSENSGLFPER